MPQYFKNVQQVYKQALSLSPLFVSPFFIVSCCHTCRRRVLIIVIVQSETSVEQILVLAAENTPPTALVQNWIPKLQWIINGSIS